MVSFPYLIIKQVITAGAHLLGKCTGTHCGQMPCYSVPLPQNSCWHFKAIKHLQTQTNKCHSGQKGAHIQMDAYGCTNTIKKMHKQNSPDSTSSIIVLTIWILPETLSSAFLIVQCIPKFGTDKQMLLCIENLLESSPYLCNLCCFSVITRIYFCLQGFYLGIKLRISSLTLLAAKCQRLRYAPGANLTDAGPCFTFYKNNKEIITVDFVSTDSPRAAITVTDQTA